MFYRVISVVFVAAFMLVSHIATAQCSMCRAVVESDISGKGSGINNGIVYLMAFPYILVFLLAVGLVYKMRKDLKDQETT